jgi:hypothetical protein
MNINAKWHLANKMPKNPSVKERIEWHLGHQKNCKCRPISEKLQKIIDRGV